MSVKHIAWVFDNTDLRGTDRLMMLAIADYADEVGACFPSYRRLADKCNITRRNAINCVNRLVDSGHIGIRQYAGIKTQNGNTNRFYMLKWRAENGMDNSDFTGDATDTSVATDTPTSDATDTPTSVATDTLTVGNRSLTVTAPKNGDARPRKRDELFDWIAENIYQQSGTVTTSAGGRIAKTKRAIREIHTVNGTELTIAHLQQFRQWWLRAYSGLTMPRSTEKLSEYYNEFYQSQKSSPARQQDAMTQQSIDAQIALGYDRIVYGLMNDEIKAKIEEMTS